MAVTATQGQPIIDGFLQLTTKAATPVVLDVSDQTYSWALRSTVASNDVTTPGEKGTYRRRGHESWMLDVVFWDDQADGGITEELYAVLGDVVGFTARHDSGSISTANPEWTGDVLIAGDFVPLQAPEDGQPPQISCSFGVNGVPDRAIS